MLRIARLALLTFAAGSLVACGGSSGSPSNGTTTTPTGVCAHDTRGDTYVDGMAKAAGGMTLKLLRADPAPPIKGNNAWDFELLDASNQPISGATITAKPYMPDHGHGTSVVPTVTPAAGGRYSVSPVYLFMPGLWQTTFEVSVAGSATQSIVYSFCIDG